MKMVLIICVFILVITTVFILGSMVGEEFSKHTFAHLQKIVALQKSQIESMERTAESREKIIKIKDDTLELMREQRAAASQGEKR